MQLFKGWMIFSLGTGVIWKVPIEGGLPVQLTDLRSNAIRPVPSPDGKLIACNFSSSIEKSGPFRMAILPFEGGEPIKTFGLTGDPVRETQWTSDSRGLTYIDDRNGISNIWIQPIDGGPAKQLTNFKSDRTLSFDWSRDGKQLVLARGTQISDVILISNFR